MATGTPFTPTPFTTTVVSPSTATQFRSIPYISPSEYRFAPTAVGTKALVAGSTNQPQDSLASLSQVISQASGWADIFCFHRGDGTLAASLTVERDHVYVKPDGSLALITNFKPILEVVGVGLGPTPSLIANISSTTAQDIWIGEKTINLPGTVANNTFPSLAYPRPTDTRGYIYAIWSYINGFPHTSLASNATAGASTITVQATNGPLVAGVYTGTQLTIHDNAQTETVVVSATPTSNVLALSSPLQYNHTVPAQPDFLRVTGLPWAIERAIIHLTSALIKLRGARGQVMGGVPGSVPSRQALAEAGALEDYEIAADLLDPFVCAYLH